ERDEHVHDAVLQRLEGADRHAELLARLEVLEGAVARELHRADRFGADQRGAEVSGFFERREVAVERLGLRAAQHDIGREALVHRAIGLQIHLATSTRNSPIAPSLRALTTKRSALGAPSTADFSPSMLQRASLRRAAARTASSAKRVPFSLWASASLVRPSTTPGSSASFCADEAPRSIRRAARTSGR